MDNINQLIIIAENYSSRYAQTVDVSDIEGFEDFTEDNFIIVNKYITSTDTSDAERASTMTKTYDKTQGILTLGKQKTYWTKSNCTNWNVYDVYLYIH